MYKNEKLLNCVFSKENAIPFGDDTLTKVALGQLNLPTGEIVATDPLTCANPEPFVIAVTPGKYDSVAFVSKNQGNNSLMALYLNGKPAVRWDIALVKGQKVLKLSKDGFYGILVDGGVGGYMDKKTYDVVRNAAGDGVLDAIINDAYANYTLIAEDFIGREKTLTFEPDLNVVMCDSSGDGAYPSYFGFDEDEQPCCLVMDFMLFETDDRYEISFDLSALDTTERPFPFFGAGMASHFEYAWLQVKFASAPDAQAIGNIIKSAPKILSVEKDDFCGSILPVLSDYPVNIKIERTYGSPNDKKALDRAAREGCSMEAQLAFELDIIRWLLEIHEFCPIEFVVRSEDGEAGGTKFSAWHYTSLKTDKLLYNLAISATECPEAEKEYFDEMVDTITNYWIGSEWGDGNEDAKWIVPDKYAFLLLEKNKMDFLESAIAENQHNEPYIAQILKGMNQFFENRRIRDDKDVYRIYRDIITSLPHLAISQNEDFLSDIVRLAVEANDEEFLTLLAGKIVHVDRAEAVIQQIYSDAFGCFLKTQDYQNTIRIFVYVFSMIDGKSPLRNSAGQEDYSIYNNMLYVLQNDNSQLPVNPKLNHKYLEICLPYGELNPDLYFNAASLYIEMEEFAPALIYMKKFFAHKNAVRKHIEKNILFIKTSEFCKNFRKHPGVMEYIDEIDAFYSL